MVWIVLGGAVLVIASAWVTYLVLADEKTPEPPAPAEAEHTAAPPRPVPPRPVPPEPVDLPIADAAGDPQPNSSRHAIIRMPVEWNEKPEEVKRLLKARFDAIRQQLEQLYGDGWRQFAVTLSAHPGLKYRFLARAVVEGRDHEFWLYNFACLKKLGDREVRYLRLSLPGTGEEMLHDPPPEVVRLEIERRDAGMEFVLNRNSVERELWALVARLNVAVRDNPDLFLVLDPDPDLTVQQFIDVYNAVLKAGIKHIALGTPRRR